MRLWHYEEVSATQANSTADFDDPGTAFPARSVRFVNDSTSAKKVYVTLEGRAATTGDIRIEPGESMSFDYSGLLGDPDGADGWLRADLICAAGETATVRVIAGR